MKHSGHKTTSTIQLFCVFAFLLIGYSLSVNAQLVTSTPTDLALGKLSAYTAKLYGADDLVVNGRKYFPEHYNAMGNPYFLTDVWIDGSLFIEGKRYDHLELLYNIDIERVILKTTIDDSLSVFLVLNNGLIEAFNLGERYFINAKSIDEGFPGFVELVYNGSFLVFSRHQKSFVSEYTSRTPNGFYSGTKSMLYILIPGQLDKLPTKKAFLNYFSDHHKDINTFMRKQKIKYKKANYIQLNKLFEYCDEISHK